MRVVTVRRRRGVGGAARPRAAATRARYRARAPLRRPRRAARRRAARPAARRGDLRADLPWLDRDLVGTLAGPRGHGRRGRAPTSERARLERIGVAHHLGLDVGAEELATLLHRVGGARPDADASGSRAGAAPRRGAVGWSRCGAGRARPGGRRSRCSSRSRLARAGAEVAADRRRRLVGVRRPAAAASTRRRRSPRPRALAGDGWREPLDGCLQPGPGGLRRAGRPRPRRALARGARARVDRGARRGARARATSSSSTWPRRSRRTRSSSFDRVAVPAQPDDACSALARGRRGAARRRRRPDRPPAGDRRPPHVRRRAARRRPKHPGRRQPCARRRHAACRTARPSWRSGPERRRSRSCRPSRPSTASCGRAGRCTTVAPRSPWLRELRGLVGALAAMSTTELPDRRAVEIVERDVRELLGSARDRDRRRPGAVAPRRRGGRSTTATATSPAGCRRSRDEDVELLHHRIGGFGALTPPARGSRGRGDLDQRARPGVRRPPRRARAHDGRPEPGRGRGARRADAGPRRPPARPVAAVRRRPPPRGQPAPRRDPADHRPVGGQHPQVRRAAGELARRARRARIVLDARRPAFLDVAVRAGLSIVVAGAVGAGKTTLLNCLASAIPPQRADRHLRGGVRAPHRPAGRRLDAVPAAEPRGRRGGRRCGTSCGRACACDRTASSSARSGAPSALDMLLALNSGAAGHDVGARELGARGAAQAHDAAAARRARTSTGGSSRRRSRRASTSSCSAAGRTGRARSPRSSRSRRRSATATSRRPARCSRAPATDLRWTGELPSGTRAVQPSAGIDLMEVLPVSVVLALLLGLGVFLVYDACTVAAHAARRGARSRRGADRLEPGWLAGGLGQRLAGAVRRRVRRRWAAAWPRSPIVVVGSTAVALVGFVAGAYAPVALLPLATPVDPSGPSAVLAGGDRAAGRRGAGRRHACRPPSRSWPSGARCRCARRSGRSSPIIGSRATSSARSSGSAIALADPTADRVVATLVIAHRVGGRELGHVLRTLGGVPARGPRGAQGDRRRASRGRWSRRGSRPRRRGSSWCSSRAGRRARAAYDSVRRAARARRRRGRDRRRLPAHGRARAAAGGAARPGRGADRAPATEAAA